MCFAFVYVHAFHGCERACGAQPVTREGVARLDKSFLENEAAGSNLPGSLSNIYASLSLAASPFEKVLMATPSALPYLFRALTHFEAPGQLREIREGLEEMDEKQLRLLIIQGMADGNDPAARSQLLHATDGFGEATKIFAERTHIYQLVIVRWLTAAVHEHFRWDIGGGS